MCSASLARHGPFNNYSSPYSRPSANCLATGPPTTTKPPPALSIPCSPERPGRLPWGHPDRAVEPYDLAVEHLVLHDVFDEIGVLLGLAETGREGDLISQRLAGAF